LSEASSCRTTGPEFLINDRLSFMRFPGPGPTDEVPDAETIRAFRERLARAGAIEALLARFDLAVRGAGCIPGGANRG
jgi:hypothetical protein